MTSKVYLVGKQGARKANSYEAMTNNVAEAERLMAEMGPNAEQKVITPQRHKRGTKNEGS